MPINNTTNDLGDNDYVQVYTIGSQGQLEPRYIKLSNLNNSLNNVGDNVGYRKYTAKLTQSGTNAPVATVLENTLGFTPTWEYVGVGKYRITHPDFVTEKTALLINGPLVGIIIDEDEIFRKEFYISSPGTILLDTWEIAVVTGSLLWTATNTLVYEDTIEIRIYP